MDSSCRNSSMSVERADEIEMVVGRYVASAPTRRREGRELPAKRQCRPKQLFRVQARKSCEVVEHGLLFVDRGQNHKIDQMGASLPADPALARASPRLCKSERISLTRRTRQGEAWMLRLGGM